MSGTAADPVRIEIPDFALVVLIGSTGAGKSTFAARHFLPTEVVSSDRCRALVADDATDQSATADAFELARAIADKRLKGRRLTVVDATNVRASDRRPWVELARRWHALPVAVVLDPGVEACVEHNRGRPDRQFGPGVVRRMVTEVRQGFGKLRRDGFRQVWKLDSAEAIAAAQIERRPLWTDKRDDAGPFAIVGDVHGCSDELEELLRRLGCEVAWSGEGPERRVAVTPPPDGRKVVFVGDLVDRGPRTPDVLRIAMRMAADGTAHVVNGNHDWKLARWLDGRGVQVGPTLQATIDQIAAEGDAFRDEVKAFLSSLLSHVWLDGGRLAVAHAGLKAEMVGRASPAVREFALYGDTTGETDELGLPVRRDWAAAYRGETAVVYGHTPVTRAEWVNNTLCVDTGCVFGHRLTALRWPERDLVDVPALRSYADALRLRPEQADPPRPLQAAADDLLDVEDVQGRRWIETELKGRVAIAEEEAAAWPRSCARKSTWAPAPSWRSAATPPWRPAGSGPWATPRVLFGPARAGRSSARPR